MAAQHIEQTSTHHGSPKRKKPGSPARRLPVSKSSPLNFNSIYHQAGEILESGRKYAVKHPYQIILGAVSVAGVGALAAYLLKRRH